MAGECYYSGISYADGSAICSGETSFACFDSRWSAQSTCDSSDNPIDREVEEPDKSSTSENIGSLAPNNDNLSRYNGRTYSQGAEICLNGSRYIASFGRWVAAGSCSTVESSLEPNEYASNTFESATESFEYCSGSVDGENQDGTLVTSSSDRKAQLKVCGDQNDLIRYWYDFHLLVYDPIRDEPTGGLNSSDVKFPGSGATPDLPRPPVAVRHGRDRDLIRIYTPPKRGKSAMVTRYEPRRPNNLSFNWLSTDKLDVAGVRFVYDASRNAFVFEGGSTFGLSILPITG